jgi:hypothetical protein
MKQVAKRVPREAANVDQDRLRALYLQLGQANADDVVCRVIEELALRLSNCERLYRDLALDELRKGVRSLIAIPDQIGMPDVSVVAGHVTACIDIEDASALASTFARLLRISEQYLSTMWNSQDSIIWTCLQRMLQPLG